MVKHNNVVPNGHFHKKWQRRVRTWFDQVSRKAAPQIVKNKDYFFSYVWTISKQTKGACFASERGLPLGGRNTA